MHVCGLLKGVTYIVAGLDLVPDRRDVRAGAAVCVGQDVCPQVLVVKPAAFRACAFPIFALTSFLTSPSSGCR